MELVAIDLEGSGAQDRDNEAILEIALVPIVDWRPAPAAAYCTLVNPGRSVPHRPWISPGLTDAVLSDAPSLAQVEPELAQRINGRCLVGHNVGVDWRLLHRRCPTIEPAGMIDTLRLATALQPKGPNGLAPLVERLGLATEVNRLAAGSTPHRALWDAVAAALLLTRFVASLLDENVNSINSLVQPTSRRGTEAGRGDPAQLSLFELGG